MRSHVVMLRNRVQEKAVSGQALFEESTSCARVCKDQVADTQPKADVPFTHGNLLTEVNCQQNMSANASGVLFSDGVPLELVGHELQHLHSKQRVTCIRKQQSKSPMVVAACCLKNSFFTSGRPPWHSKPAGQALHQADAHLENRELDLAYTLQLSLMKRLHVIEDLTKGRLRVVLTGAA